MIRIPISFSRIGGTWVIGLRQWALELIRVQGRTVYFLA